jgi:hypothetical protein
MSSVSAPNSHTFDGKFLPYDGIAVEARPIRQRYPALVKPRGQEESVGMTPPPRSPGTVARLLFG